MYVSGIDTNLRDSQGRTALEILKEHPAPKSQQITALIQGKRGAHSLEFQISEITKINETVFFFFLCIFVQLLKCFNSNSMRIDKYQNYKVFRVAPVELLTQMA